MNTINKEESAYKMLKTFCETILQSATENIPRSKPTKYKPFWIRKKNRDTELDKKPKSYNYRKT